MPFDLSQFKVQKAVLEIRYAPAFLIWDRTGHIWNQVQSAFPDLKSQKVQPNLQSLMLNKTINATLAIENSHLAGRNLPNDLKPFSDACQIFFPIIVTELKLANLTRIGFRIFYEKVFSSKDADADKDAAADFALGNLPSFKRSGKFFNTDGRLRDVDFALRWEGENTGAFARVQTVQQKLETEIPAEFDNIAEPVKVQKTLLLIDVDYYAHSNTPVSKFNAPALIESWAHAIRRDLTKFVHG